MKRMTQWVLAAIIVCGASFFTACTSNDDNFALSKQQEMEKSVIGLWYEEFEYKDVTENGKPFNRALIAVEAKADHTLLLRRCSPNRRLGEVSRSD